MSLERSVGQLWVEGSHFGLDERRHLHDPNPNHKEMKTKHFEGALKHQPEHGCAFRLDLKKDSLTKFMRSA